MKVPSWGENPRDSIERECERRGKDKVVGGCMSLLSGKRADAELIYALGGPPARWVFTGEAPGPDYWLRVWAVRGLLWAWDDAALTSIVTALSDDAWRVREMALRVVAKHRLSDAATAVASLRDDPNSRVASAASRTLARLHTSSPTDRAADSVTCVMSSSRTRHELAQRHPVATASTTRDAADVPIEPYAYRISRTHGMAAQVGDARCAAALASPTRSARSTSRRRFDPASATVARPPTHGHAAGTDPRHSPVRTPSNQGRRVRRGEDPQPIGWRPASASSSSSRSCSRTSVRRASNRDSLRCGSPAGSRSRSTS